MEIIKGIFGTLINLIFIICSYVKTEFNYLFSLIVNKSFSLSTKIILRTLRIYLDITAYLTTNLFFPSKKGKVPAITDRLLLQPANQLVDQIKNGKVCQSYYL